MGVKGFFGYLNRCNTEGVIVEHSIDEILSQIRLYREKHNKSPKILFNLRVFNNYYEETAINVIFGCRFNAIKKDFEQLLSAMKAAGAELIFVSKKNYTDNLEDVNFAKFDDEYKRGLDFVKFIENGRSSRDLNNQLSRMNRARLFPWQETTVHVLVQSAKNFGTFMEGDCFMNSTAAQMKLASDEDVFAICGLNTSYLFYKGPWKIFFPAKNTRSHSKEMIFKEFCKEKILQHFRLNDDQFQLFAVLGGKLNTSLEHTRTLNDHFISCRSTNFNAIATFVRSYAPPENFPLQRETIDRILDEIFGYPDEQLRKDFEIAVSYQATREVADNICSIEEKTKKLLQNDSFSSFAECVLYDIPVTVLSPFLDVKATDMKPLKDLTLDWIERFAGVLLRDIDGAKIFTVIYRLPSGKLEKINATPQFSFGLPDWNQLIADEVTIEEKFETLQFLISDLISIEKLKTIPFEYMMHVIITMHLIKNNSMTMREAIAMTKAVCDNTESNFTVIPQKVNVRAFRISALYEKIYSVLLMCLSPLGLNEFIADLKLDNVSFQNYLADGSESQADDAFKSIMTLIN